MAVNPRSEHTEGMMSEVDQIGFFADGPAAIAKTKIATQAAQIEALVNILKAAKGTLAQLRFSFDGNTVGYSDASAQINAIDRALSTISEAQK